MTNNASDNSFQLIRDAHTSAGNYDMSTDDIIQRLAQWQSLCAFTVTEAKGDRLTIKFTTLPANMDAFAQELYDFCPDLVDQGTGCVAELVEMAEEVGQELEPALTELLEGIDFSDENYGVEILKRQVVRNKELDFWWD